jgi:solute carrier family 15 (peptide/histidine transporter), member 3/4
MKYKNKYGVKRYGIPMRTPLEKMSAGMLLEVFIMLGAGFLEVYRRYIASTEGGLIGPSVCYSGEEGSPQAANLSIFWQVPLFVLMGVSEILTSISSMDFFYSEVCMMHV